MMNKYMVTVEINGLFEYEIRAENLEDALSKAKDINPGDVIKLKNTKRSAVLDWETRKLTSVYEA